MNLKNVLMKYVDKNNLNVDFCTYDNENFIIVDGWGQNERLIDFLDKHHIDYGFSDNYCTCTECCNVIDTQDRSKFYLGDGFIICLDCFDNYHDIYLEELINNPAKCNQLLTVAEIECKGFDKINDAEYQNGLHGGMNDNPTEIYNQYKTEYKDIIFHLTNTSQFYLEFDVYGRKG